jgi:hypothetical protein
MDGSEQCMAEQHFNAAQIAAHQAATDKQFNHIYDYVVAIDARLQKCESTVANTHEFIQESLPVNTCSLMDDVKTMLANIGKLELLQQSNQNEFDKVTSTVENFVWKMGTDTRALSVEITKLDKQLLVEQEKIDELENHIIALQIDSATSLKRTDILDVMDAHALERSMNPCDPPPSISLPAGFRLAGKASGLQDEGESEEQDAGKAFEHLPCQATSTS